MGAASVNHWLVKIGNELARKPEPVPPGWKTVRQLMSEARLKESTCKRFAKRGVAANLIEVRKFRITTGKITRPVPHYRQKTK